MKITDLPADALAKVQHLVSGLEGVELPTPSGWHVLALQYVRAKESKGGIIMPEKALREDVYQGRTGIVLALGPDAYADQSRFKSGAWCKPGDCIMWPAVEGAARRFNYGENITLAVIADDSVLAVNVDPVRATGA